MAADLSDREIRFVPAIPSRYSSGRSIFTCIRWSSSLSAPEKADNTPIAAVYAAAKEAIRAISRVAAGEWGKYGIRVNTCSPAGMTDHVTADIDNLSDDMKAYILNGFKANPLCRLGDPYDDIAPAVVFLASDDSCWATGQNLNVEGGGNIHS